MNKQKDSIFFSKLMNAADMGWWKADLTTSNYECSEYVSEFCSSSIGRTGLTGRNDNK